MFASKAFAERGFMDPKAARTAPGSPSGELDAGFELWRALNLELWARTYLDAQPASNLPATQLVAEPGNTQRAERVELPPADDAQRDEQRHVEQADRELEREPSVAPAPVFDEPHREHERKGDCRCR